jgi:hypothetical protein
VGTTAANVTVELWLNNAKVATVALPNTGSESAFQNTAPISFTIGAGMNVLRAKIVSGNAVAISKITIQ